MLKVDKNQSKYPNVFVQLKKMNILLIDDDELIRDSLNIFFETQGCCLKTVATAEAGIAEIYKNNYDIVIVDYQLPGINGLEFLKNIQISHPNMLKILISAYGNHEISSETLKTGVWDIIEKPFNMKAIHGVLTRLIINCQN